MSIIEWVMAGICLICLLVLAFIFVGFAWALDKAQREGKTVDEVLNPEKKK